MIITRTPFRISFFGGGTDYPVWYENNGGAVLSTSINKYCYITCRYLPPFFEHKHRIIWTKVESVKITDEIQHPAVRAGLKFLNVRDGVEIHHDGDLPARTGLGSSSSFTVGLLHALHALQNQEISKEELAKEAVRMEQDILKENVGSQDQVAVTYGGFNKITFSQNGEFRVEPVQVSNEQVKELESSLRLYFTGFSRYASEVAKTQIENIQNRERELTQMHTMVDEGIRILNGNKGMEEFGRLLNETWQIKKSLSDKISNPEIDAMYEKAIEAGALGGKLLGAGAGGFLLLLIPPDKQQAVREALHGFLEVSFAFENNGSQIIYKNHQA